MELSDVQITIKSTEQGFVIVDIEHAHFEIATHLLDKSAVDDILSTLVAFVKGEVDYYDVVKRVWSDGDPEEPSSDYYVILRKHTGAVQDLIDDMSSLVRYLHNDKYAVYRLRVEDNLI